MQVRRPGVFVFVIFVTLATALISGVYIWADSFWNMALSAQTHNWEPGVLIYDATISNKTTESLSKIGCPHIIRVRIATGQSPHGVLIYYKVRNAHEVTVSGVRAPSNTEGWIELELEYLQDGQISVVALSPGCTVTRNFQVKTYRQMVIQAAVLGVMGIGLGMLLDVFTKVLMQGNASLLLSVYASLGVFAELVGKWRRDKNKNVVTEGVKTVTRRAGRQFSDILVWFVWLLGAFYTGWSAYNLGWPLYLNLVLGLYVLVLVVKMYGFIKPPKSLLAARALSSLKVLRE